MIRPLGAYDIPDERDWKPEKIFGDSLPPDILTSEYINLVNIRAKSQTVNNCTSQGIRSNILMMIRLGEKITDSTDNFYLNLDAKESILWERQHKIAFDENGKQLTYGSANINGDSLQNAMKTAKYVGIPILIGDRWINVKLDSYARIQTDEIEMWQRKGRPAYTGCDWVYKRRKNGVLSSTDERGYLWDDGIGTGHCVTLPIKEQDIGLFNSHGERWGINKNGTAYVSPTKLQKFYSKYIFQLDFQKIKDDYAGRKTISIS